MRADERTSTGIVDHSTAPVKPRKQPAAKPRVAPKAAPQTFTHYAPVAYKGFYVSQGYGHNGHSGIDIGVDRRTDVQAVSVTRGTVVAPTGFVTRPDGSPSYGNLVVVKDDEGYTHYYAHLARMDVQVGQTVDAGTPLGIVGQTGNASGIHLHYEVRAPNGGTVDPTVDTHEHVQDHAPVAQGYAPSSGSHARPAPAGADQETHAPDSDISFGDVGPDPGFTDPDPFGIADHVSEVLGFDTSKRDSLASSLQAAHQRLAQLHIDAAQYAPKDLVEGIS